MAGISACASFPVVAVDSALRPEAVEGQGAAATAVAAPKTVTESESSASASASMEPEEQVEEPAKKRKRDPAPDVGSSSMDGTDGQGSEDDKNDDGEEAPVLQAVSPPRQNALQRLVDECRVLLDGSSKSTQPPNSTTVSRIVALLNGIGPDDLKLGTVLDTSEVTRAAAFRRRDPIQVIGGNYLYECDNFTVAVFYLPAGTVMPLHDHPGMTVFSKLLAGSVHVQSFDWVSPSVYGSGGKRAVHSKNTKLVKKVLDHVVEAGCGTWVLYPSTGGNLHRFVAGVDGPCAFLDVLTPPYSEGRLRRCTFYRDYPFQLHRNHRFGRNLSAQEKSQFAWLRPINASAPPDLRIVPLTYSGPPVV
uniref:cysteine dioxygenase n=1 Tax=Oryza meridionalis TaxID=40149 RepID=A0A0E0D436_9ORYZ